jgi:hypothetical protein
MITFFKYSVYGFENLKNRVPMASQRVPVRPERVPVRTERVPVRTQQVLIGYEFTKKEGGMQRGNPMETLLRFLNPFRPSSV